MGIENARFNWPLALDLRHYVLLGVPGRLRWGA
jgi:hypothetical protein